MFQDVGMMNSFRTKLRIKGRETMENKTGAVSSGGIGFGGLLQIAFIVLKLCGVINWKWIWVLAPTWIGLLVAILIIVIAIIFIKL